MFVGRCLRHIVQVLQNACVADSMQHMVCDCESCSFKHLQAVHGANTSQLQLYANLLSHAQVHERTLQGDFLMALLRDLVTARRAAGNPLKASFDTFKTELPAVCLSTEP